MAKSHDHVTTRDQLGRHEDKGFFIKQSDEVLVVEEGPTLLYIESIGHSFILGSTTNGILGTNTGTEDGQQQVLGEAGRVISGTQVISPNNRAVERFTTTNFEDTGSTTADWADTEGTCVFTSGEIAQSLTFAADGTTWLKATLTIDDATNLTLQMSADGGSNWENVTNGTEHVFTNTGTDLRFKLTASGNATITSLIILYEG